MRAQFHPLDRLQCRRGALYAWTLGAVASLSPLAIHTALATEPTPEQVSTKVTLADLDLSTPEGAQAARERLKIAAQRLCTKVVDSRSVAATIQHQECSAEALARALQRLDGLLRVARS